MFRDDPKRVRTGLVRLSYAKIIEPETKDRNGNPLPKPKYGAALLIPKSDIATYQEIQNAFRYITETDGPKAWGFAKPQPITTLHDGDGIKQNGRPYGDECKGHWVLSANSVRQPGVVNLQGGQVPMTIDDIYSGMYVIATLTFFANNKGGADICCALDNMQKVQDGERLAGGASADDDFGDTYQSAAANDFAPQQPVQPQYGAAPAQYNPTQYAPMAPPPTQAPPAEYQYAQSPYQQPSYPHYQ